MNIILSTEIIDCINKSVLCWLATSSKENIPNVSPKEIFCSFEADKIIVANIASLQTVKNINQNKMYVLVLLMFWFKKDFNLLDMPILLIKTIVIL